jgi:hypothetical protein
MADNEPDEEADISAALGAVRQAAAATTAGDLNGVVIAAMAASAHKAGASALANDVSALALQQLELPGSSLTLLQVLTDTTSATGPTRRGWRSGAIGSRRSTPRRGSTPGST